MLLVALGLGALLWSCEDEQTGYEVTIPLIGPVEFDGTSCEISGDVCSTDDDCFDEDGFNVGPCTKTLKKLEPITVAVSLSPGTPSYTFPTPNTTDWLSTLAVLQNTDASPITITMENFSITGGPVTLSVEPFSRIGLYLGHDADYVPVSVSSCTFTLDDSATGQDYADGISTCLTDWVKENGAPLQFDMEVTSSAGASAKSGYVSKQNGTYAVDGTHTLDPTKDCEGEASEELLDAAEEGSDFFGLLQCGDLTFSGSGTTSAEIDIRGVATIYDRCGNELAKGGLGGAFTEPPQDIRVGPGDYTVDLVGEDDVMSSVPVVFDPPDPNTFFESIVFAATGGCESGTPIRDSGYGAVVWHHCGTNPDEVRTGNITWGASGFCSVPDDSGGGGGSGQ